MYPQPNSRQFPSKEEKLNDKKLHDILYLLFQSLSEWDGDLNEERYIPKDNINKSQLAKVCGYKTRNTLYSHINDLIENGYINETEEKYILPNLNSGEYFLIPYDTAQFLVGTQTTNVIKVYVYLANRWMANKQEGFGITYKKLCEVVNLYWNDQNNRETISNILLTLHNNFLLTITDPYYYDGYMRCDVKMVGNKVSKRKVE